MDAKVMRKIAIVIICMLLMSTMFIVTLDIVSADQNGDYTYQITNREANITAYTGMDSVIIIPSKLGVYNVTTIWDEAFKNKNFLINVTIPNTVTYIGQRVFIDCHNLSSIKLLMHDPPHVCSCWVDRTYPSIKGHAYATSSFPKPDEFWDDGNLTMGVNIGPPTADFTFTPSSPTNLDVIKFTDISTDSDGTIIYWNWNFDDGNFSTQQNPSHTYTNKGTYTVSLTITNNNGIEENQSHAVVVIVDTEDPSTVTGLSVIDAKDGKLNLAWNAATDNIAVNHYKIYRNNVFLLNRTTTSYQDTGLTNGQSYSYQVSAVDSSGNEGNLSTSVSGTPTKSSGGGGTTPTEPENKKPIANASAGKPYHGLVNSEIIFNGSGSSDSDGTITKWFWDFGDNTTGTGKTVTHTFSQAGNYTVTITVTDDDGATNTDTTICMISQNITQPNRPPTKPMIIGTTVGSTNTRYTYTVVSKDPDNDTIQYTFDWGEPTNQSSGFLPNGTSYSVNHSWTTPGQYILTVTVTDNQTEAFSSMTININAVEKKPSTPGFELVFVIGAIAVAMFLLRKKRSV